MCRTDRQSHQTGTDRAERDVEDMVEVLTALAWQAYCLGAMDLGDAITKAADIAIDTAWRRSLS